MKKNENANKGITLIALVITIIVLLILAGVSISTLVGENGIINKAKLAKEKTEKSNILEKVQMEVSSSFNNYGEYDTNIIKGNLESNLGANVTKVNKSLYVELDGRKLKVKSNGEVEFETKIERTGIKIGDYIDYKPTVTSIKSEQGMMQDDGMEWRVLRINENGIIDLIGNQTTQTVHLEKAEGYNNGVTIINKICRDLYSNTEHGIVARSIKQEDIEAVYKPGSDAEKAKEDIKKAKVTIYNGKKATGEVYENRYYPAIYEKEINSNIDGREKGTLGPSDESEIIKGNENMQIKKGNIEIKVKPNWYKGEKVLEDNFIDGAYDVLNTNNMYWVASRYVFGYENEAGFGIRRIYTSNFPGRNMIYSNGETSSNSMAIRPIVSLESNIQIDTLSGENSSKNPYKIEW